MRQDTKAAETPIREASHVDNLDYATIATAMPVLLESDHPAMAKIAEAIQQSLDERHDSIVTAYARELVRPVAIPEQI